VVRDTLGMVEHQMSGNGIKVDLDLEESVPRFRGSPDKLQQVLLNLVLNARDAMEEGGTLRIETSHDDVSARVVVADTGSGIPPATLARIFDPFFTTKGAKKGTGLGLSVSYGIVREHGGDIEVSSQEGRGTRFLLTFPRAGAAVREAGGPREAAVTDGRQPARAAPGAIEAPAVARTQTGPSIPARITARGDRMMQ
jgi:hypothetical protein